MIHYTEIDDNLIRIVKMEKMIPKEELSERIVDEISFLQNSGGNTIVSEDDFQLIICDAAAAWAVRRNDDGRFLAKIGVFALDETHEDAWTQNLRDAIVLTDELKARMIANSFRNAHTYEAVPLIYQVEPLFKSQS